MAAETEYRDPHPWEGRRPESPWDETVVVSSWAEMGTQTVSVEGLYQAFKARLLVELQASDGVARFDLVPVVGSET